MAHTQQSPRILSSLPLDAADAKWVTLKVINWEDQNGKERRWEVAERKTRGSSGIDGVAILALLRPKSGHGPLSTVIIEQFRPPAGKFVIEIMIELPAGLVDEGEDPETAAVRELEEETGFKAERVIESSPEQASDPGMTTANMKLVTVEVLIDNIEDPLPTQKLDVGEHIVRKIVPLDELNTQLKDYARRGFAIDARLSHFATGWELNSSIRRT